MTSISCVAKRKRIANGERLTATSLKRDVGRHGNAFLCFRTSLGCHGLPHHSASPVSCWRWELRRENWIPQRKTQIHPGFIHGSNWATFKTLVTFYYTDWFVGILMLAYYTPHIPGLNNQTLDLPYPPVTVANEALGWGSLLKVDLSWGHPCAHDPHSCSHPESCRAPRRAAPGAWGSDWVTCFGKYLNLQ